jgi:hypothetical protein
VEDEPVHFAPGAEFRYSNTNYYLLAMIIERLSGLSYDDYLRTHVFGPAGMARSSATEVDGADGDAVGYKLDADDRLVPADRIDLSVPSGAGGVRSTAIDLLLWQHALYTGTTLLTEASRVKLLTPFKQGYAFGIGHALVDGHTVYQEGTRPGARQDEQERRDAGGHDELRERLDPPECPGLVPCPGQPAEIPDHRQEPRDRSQRSRCGRQHAPQPVARAQAVERVRLAVSHARPGHGPGDDRPQDRQAAQCQERPEEALDRQCERKHGPPREPAERRVRRVVRLARQRGEEPAPEVLPNRRLGCDDARESAAPKPTRTDPRPRRRMGEA